MTQPVPFRLMRARIQAVTIAVATMTAHKEFPNDKEYLALTYGMMAASGKSRQLTRVQIEARLIAWVMHFQNGLKLLPDGHPLRADMLTAGVQFATWVRMPVAVKEGAGENNSAQNQAS